MLLPTRLAIIWPFLSFCAINTVNAAITVSSSTVTTPRTAPPATKTQSLATTLTTTTKSHVATPVPQCGQVQTLFKLFAKNDCQGNALIYALSWDSCSSEDEQSPDLSFHFQSAMWMSGAIAPLMVMCQVGQPCEGAITEQISEDQHTCSASSVGFTFDKILIRT